MGWKSCCSCCWLLLNVSIICLHFCSRRPFRLEFYWPHRVCVCGSRRKKGGRRHKLLRRLVNKWACRQGRLFHTGGNIAKEGRIGKKKNWGEAKSEILISSTIGACVQTKLLSCKKSECEKKCFWMVAFQVFTKYLLIWKRCGRN